MSNFKNYYALPVIVSAIALIALLATCSDDDNSSGPSRENLMTAKISGAETLDFSTTEVNYVPTYFPDGGYTMRVVTGGFYKDNIQYGITIAVNDFDDGKTKYDIPDQGYGWFVVTIDDNNKRQYTTTIEGTITISKVTDKAITATFEFSAKLMIGEDIVKITDGQVKFSR